MAAKAPTLKTLRKISMEVRRGVDKILPKGVKVEVEATFLPRAPRQLTIIIVDWPTTMNMINHNFVAYVQRCKRDGHEPHPEVYPQLSMESEKLLDALQDVLDPYLNEWVVGSIVFNSLTFTSEWQQIAESLPRPQRYRPRYPAYLEMDSHRLIVSLLVGDPS